jgi:TetR/AcrR family transcriptional regulator, regulator of biofilm formation and stress response
VTASRTRERADRPTRAEQRAERRGAIVDAAVRIIATRGLPALTHRAVAREAKVPLAATTYYFASKDEILREALEALAAAEVERLAELAARIREISSADKLASLVAEALFPDPEDAERRWIAQFEIYLEAARDPALRPAVEHWRAAFVEVAESALRVAGAPEPEGRAELAVAGMNGLLLDRIRGIGEDPRQRLQVRLGELFTLLVGR